MMQNSRVNAQNKLEMDFNISNRYYSFQILEDDCKNEVTDALGATDTVIGLGNGFKQVDIALDINQTEIEESTSNIWTPTTIGGNISFCVALSLYLDDSEDDLVNFLETTHKVSIDTTAGFSVVDITAEKKAALSGGEIELDYSEAIEAYQCDSNFEQLDSPPALRQGDVMEICIKSQDANSIFEVEQIYSFNVTQDQSIPTLELISNEGNTNLYEELTEVTYDSNGQTKTGKVKFQLLGMFFEDENPDALTVTGTAKLALKNRRLQGSTSRMVVTTDRTLLEKSNDDNAAAFALEV